MFYLMPLNVKWDRIGIEYRSLHSLAAFFFLNKKYDNSFMVKSYLNDSIRTSHLSSSIPKCEKVNEVIPPFLVESDFYADGTSK